MSIAAIAAGLGLSRRGRNRWGPCPSCGCAGISPGNRPPVRVRKAWWTCHACGEWGDGIALAGAHLGFGTKLSGKMFIEARKLAASCAGTEIVEQEIERPAVRLPVEEGLSRAVPLERAPPHVARWLAARGLGLDIPAAYLPNPPRWFPLGFPLVAPAFSGAGKLMSMHGRGIDGEHKTAWPRGPWPCELLMLDPKWVRPWVQGTAKAPDVVLLAEGITDYWTAATKYPTIGIASGSSKALSLLKIPSTTKVFSTMDPDVAGAGYEERIADALWPHPVRPLPLRRLSAQWT